MPENNQEALLKTAGPLIGKKLKWSQSGEEFTSEDNNYDINCHDLKVFRKGAVWQKERMKGIGKLLKYLWDAESRDPNIYVAMDMARKIREDFEK